MKRGRLKGYKLIISFLVLLFFINPLSAASSDDSCKQFNGTVSKGSKGAKVTFLQKKLLDEGFLSNKYRQVYDNDTFNAVKMFQKKYGLAQVGNVGPQTMNKMKLLWCPQEIKNGTSQNSQTTQVQTLPDSSISFTVGDVVKIKNPKICSIKGGTIDWDDGQINVLGNLNSTECENGFTHLYLPNHTYSVKILENNVVKYKIEVKTSNSLAENPTIDQFSSTYLSKGSYLFKWKTNNTNDCVLSNGSLYSEKVKPNDSKIIDTTGGTIFEISCQDPSDRKATAWTVAGNEADNKKFLIRQFNYIKNKENYSVVWDSSDNATRCFLEGDANTSKSGTVVYDSTFKGTIKLICSNDVNDIEQKDLHLDTLSQQKIVQINYFNYNLDKNILTLSWDVDTNQPTCRLSGGQFIGRWKEVSTKEQKISFIIQPGLTRFKLSCANSRSQGAIEKTLDVFLPF